MIKLNQLKLNLQEPEPRERFFPSDFGRSNLDIYFNMIGEPRTNPPTWNETLKWGAGKGMEESMLQVLKDSGVVPQNYNQEEHGRVQKEVDGIEVSGKMDAITIEGEPIEIKSINNKNKFDIRRYEDGEPRENYVGQLALYMYLLGKKTGYLFVATVDGLKYFLFPCSETATGVYECGKTVVSVPKEIERWKMILECVKKKTPPKSDILYKYPIESIDWMQIKNDFGGKKKIENARNNRAVIGDYQVKYSDYKDKIIELEGSSLGYSDEEVDKIKEATKGYTTW